MKFLLCLVLSFAVAQATHLRLGGAVTYSAGVAPVVYRAPLAYSSYVAAVPVVKTYAAPTVALASPLVKSVYSPSVVYGGLSGYGTLLKK